MLNTLILAGFIACGDKSDDTGLEDTDVTDTGTDTDDTDTDTDDTGTTESDSYTFTNADGESSVSYSGQIFRHLLIADVKSYVSGLQDKVENDVKNFNDVGGL